MECYAAIEKMKFLNELIKNNLQDIMLSKKATVEYVICSH